MDSKNGISVSDTGTLHIKGLKGGAAKMLKMIQEGKMPKRMAFTDGFKMPENVGADKHIIVLGAGVGGLTTAYQLLYHQTGYRVTVVEAMDRVGGRSLTLRKGDTFTEVEKDEEGRTRHVWKQKCDFDEHEGEDKPYLNAGPGRIPSAHRNVLNLCKQLDVDLEVYIMQTRSNLVYSSVPQSAYDSTNSSRSGDRDTVNRLMVNRRVANDTRGYIAEYLFRFVDNIVDLNATEKREFRNLLITFGALQSDGPEKGKYQGTSRSGYEILPGVHQPGKIIAPITINNLLDSAFWLLSFYQPEDYLWQATSFQPAGGMDMIEKTLAQAITDLGGTIHLQSPVKGIRRKGQKWMVTTESKVELAPADMVISNIPIRLLRDKVRAKDFSPEYYEALDAVFKTKEFMRPTVKVGWQSQRKFWQDPADPNEIPIFGGISYTSDPMTQMWYPSTDFHAEYGILTGTYNYGDNATNWGKLPPEKRLEMARRQAANLHGDDFADQLDHGVTIAWQNIPTQEGGWNDWKEVARRLDSEEAATEFYNRLLNGDHGFFVVGDQVSTLPGWKEGAIASALNVFGQIASVSGHVTPRIANLPDVRASVETMVF